MSSFLFFGISIWLHYLVGCERILKRGNDWNQPLSWLFALGFGLICGYLADKTKRPSLLATILFLLTASFLTASYIITRTSYGRVVWA